MSHCNTHQQPGLWKKKKNHTFWLNVDPIISAWVFVWKRWVVITAQTKSPEHSECSLQKTAKWATAVQPSVHLTPDASQGGQNPVWLKDRLSRGHKSKSYKYVCMCVCEMSSSFSPETAALLHCRFYSQLNDFHHRLSMWSILLIMCPSHISFPFTEAGLRNPTKCYTLWLIICAHCCVAKSM